MNEVDKALKDLVKIKFLKFKKGLGYKYNPIYKRTLKSIKTYCETPEEYILEALYQRGYFKIARTTEEITLIIRIMLLKGQRKKRLGLK